MVSKLLGSDCYRVIVSVRLTILIDIDIVILGFRGGRWPSGLERWLGLATGRSRPGSNPTSENVSLRNFGNSIYPALPVSFGGDTNSRGSFYLVSMSGKVKDPTSPHWNV